MIIFIKGILFSNQIYKRLNYNPKVIGRKCQGESKTKLAEINITFNSQISKFNTSFISLNRWDKNKGLIFPQKMVPELAEEIGISIGDGFLSNKRFEYRLKGDKREREYYDFFIKQLYKKLYNLDVNIKEYESTYGFEICSEGLWNFKNKILGIQSGRKDNIPIPSVIKVKDEKVLASFIRGLFDTDGSVAFVKKYSLGNYYPIISLSLKSKVAIIETAEIIKMLGLQPKISKTGEYWSIYLAGYKRLESYSKIIGWSNPKNINKVINWKRKYPKLGKEVMAAIV